MTSIQTIRNIFEQNKGKKEQIKETITKTKVMIKDKEDSLHKHEEALEIIRTVGLQTQQQLQYRISGITSLALESIFDNPYQLKAEFVQRRNKTECDLFFTRGDMICNPLDSSGGGPTLIGAIALRIASWSMQNPRSRNTLILDEPFHFLHGKDPTKETLEDNLLAKASQLLSQISKQLNLQIIVVSHSPELIEFADKVFMVSKTNGKRHSVSRVMDNTNIKDEKGEENE